jgi:hypothetical protein
MSFKSVLALVVSTLMFNTFSFSQNCNCDRTPVGGFCAPAGNCGIPARNACIASGGVWLFQIDCPQDLPVSLLENSIDYSENGVTLNWKTASERDNDFFTVQTSKDGYYWDELGTVKSVGNSSSETTYTFEDTNPFVGKSYYRVYQTDFNGTVNEVFKIVSEYSNSKYVFYPVPVSKLLFIEGRNLEVSDINVFNSIGEKVILDYKIENEKINFDFSEIKNGAYFVSIQNDNTKHTERIIVFHK